MNKNFILVFSLLMISACNYQPAPVEVQVINVDSIKKVLMKTDIAFSNLSKEKGRNESFLEYMDEHVTMLLPNSLPLVGKDTMRKRFTSRPDTSYTLTWSPLFADVAASGDLGYTYGIWKLVTRSGETGEGTYCSIWKKDADGKWKFVVDTGNEGLKPVENTN